MGGIVGGLLGPGGSIIGSGLGGMMDTLTVNATVTASYDQPNTLTPAPFGSMNPNFEFTGVSWANSGGVCNVTAHLNCHYPWGVSGGGNLDVPSATDAVVTNAPHAASGKKTYEAIADDLTPRAGSPFKSPRNWFWSQALTERHERFHGTDDWGWINSAGKPAAVAFINSQTVRGGFSTDGAVRALLSQARQRIADGSDAFYGASLGHDARPGEIRAYTDGRASYTALANAVTAQGAVLDAAPAPGGAPAGGTAPAPGGGPAPAPAPGGHPDRADPA